MSDQNAIKIVIDTNVWIRFVIGRALDRMVQEIGSGKVVIYFSDELLNEFFEVISRPKFKAQISESKIAEIMEITKKKGKTINPEAVISDCRDRKDNFLLEIAVSAKADYIVTGDLDLIVLNPYRGINIVNSVDFENILIEKNK